MKNIYLRLLTFMLALVMCVSLAACGEKTPDGSDPSDDPSDPVVLYDLRDYSIVYSNKISNRAADAVTALASVLSGGTGIEYIPNIDAITDVAEKEILIGNTKRPESAEALALVTDDNSFVIKTIGNSIVINAKNDGVLIVALNYFAKLATQNGCGFTEELEYVSSPVSEVKVVDGGASEFKIVHLAGLDTSLSDANAKYDIDVKLSYDLQKEMKSELGLTLGVLDDGIAREYEILIGETTRQESIDFRNSLAFNEYGYEVVGNKIVVSGTNSTTNHLAIDLFAETVMEFGDDGYLLLYDGMRITRRSATWNINIPEFEGGTFGGTLDSGQSVLTWVYKDTTAEAFEAYCDKLEAEGYELWQRHDIEDNLHATYTHEERGMIHTYYTANEQNVRIISYRKGKYNLPTNIEKPDYDVVTQSSVTQYGLDRANDSVGMCYVITLADGSFIVVDSGTQNKDNNMHAEFYELLKSLNKRPDGKILIRAWYLTHEHGDHYIAFSNFLKDYGKEITIEEFWCNPASADYTYNSDNGGRTFEKNHSKYQSYVNGDFEWINLHTGMEFYVCNMKFEVLYTEEDLFPKVCRSFNNTILIMKMTDTKSGQTMLWMGDLLKDGCETLAEKYDGYLKSDLLQVAHHGKSEALPVYQETLPTVAFWSCTTAQMQSQTSNKTYKDTNVFLRDNVATHITSDATYTIYLPYSTGDKIYKWEK